MRNFLCAITVVWCLSITSPTFAQETRNSPSISLKNPKLPFVYLVFDHIGPGVPEFDSEPPTRVWLRLVNNSSMPILVWTQSIPDGRPSGEVGVVDKIGRTRELLICASKGVAEPELPPVANLIEPGEKSAKTQQQKVEKAPLETSPPGCMDEPPVGYLDIPEYHLSKLSIDSGRDALFSLPVNHIAISGFWYIEIPFWFQSLTSDTRANGEPNLGGSVSTTVQYGLENIPKERLDEFRAAYYRR
jgi:hypothetical protein